MVLAVGLYLYTLFGGADFGAGILEIFTGKKGEAIISKALAPVWEANHVWLILVIVILFNAFPEVYASLSTALHIPLMIVLLGIVIRGTAFTFRHYDIEEDDSHRWYTFLFRFSSVLTPFFLGVILGAMILGRMNNDLSMGFHAVYIKPWMNWFCMSLGLFSCCLFCYIAAGFIFAEAAAQNLKASFDKEIKWTLIASILSGGLVFLSGYISKIPFVFDFIKNPLSIGCILLSIGSIPFVLKAVKGKNFQFLRGLVAVQLVLIFVAWAVNQYPVFIQFKDGQQLTILNAHAGASTLKQMGIALVIGLLLILPGLFFLFKTFKAEETISKEI